MQSLPGVVDDVAGEGDHTRSQSRQGAYEQKDEPTAEGLLEIYGSQFPWMSGKELLDLAQLFDRANSNGNGYIDIPELTKLLRDVVRELFDYVSPFATELQEPSVFSDSLGAESRH